MSWHPADLVSDVDLTDYESTILTQFNVTNWTGMRTKALEDWLFPILKGRNFDPFKLRTRAELDKAFGFTAAAYTDVTGATKDTTADDLNLAAIFATPASDALYLGSTQPFRGVFVRMLDTVSAVASVLSVTYWNGAWASLTIADGTAHTSGKTFSGGGSVTWTLPVDWATRIVNASDALYWLKLTVSAVPTSAKAGQIGVIRSSSLRAPATLRTLQLIFRAAPTSQDGPWMAKGDYYEKEADAALQRALAICGADFDTDASDLISPDEADQTPAEVSDGWSLERM